MASDVAIASVERLFQALADRTRLRLLNLIADQEVCVCYLVEVLGLAQPTISRHLAYLRRSGIVAARRQGKWMHYRIVFPQNAAARQVLIDVVRAFSTDKAMQKERSRLRGACCARQRFVRLSGAPIPAPVSGWASGKELP
jgi:ArsR family transcriptional regulator, arsenate/arsenite/antimonite-responsive transcriptional repressor